MTYKIGYPQIRRDEEANAVYIKLTDGEVNETQRAGKQILIDKDKDGEWVGIEVLL